MMGKEAKVRIDRRVYRARDNRLVWEGDPDAAFLAYPAGREVPDSVVAQIGAKQTGKPQDKQADKPEDKAAGGLTIKRQSRRAG